LTGQQLVIFGTQVEEVRKRLSAVVNSYLDYIHQPQAEEIAEGLAKDCLALAQAGSELRKRIFKPSEGERVARDVAKWLEKLHAQKVLQSLEVVTEGWLPVPWNLLYDGKPDEQAFLSGKGTAHWGGFWGIRYNLAGSQRVDVLRVTPLRRMPWSEKPRVMLVVDPGVCSRLPEPQQSRLRAFASAHDLPFIRSKKQLAEALREGRPDLLYWLGHATPEALHLGDEDDYKVTPSDLTEMLEGDGEDERIGGLVFLNACRTAEASPSAGSFFKAVFGLKMSGLIATEQQTIDTFACPFGLDFLEAVLDRAEEVGTALQQLRSRVPKELEHLPHRVLLGVLYGTYCPAELRVVRPAPPTPLTEQAAAEPVGGGVPLGGNLLGAQQTFLPLPLPEKPYRSLHYYERVDRPLFAGREGDVIRVARMLGAPDTRMLVLHGESGCGKSSFLRAGLLPYLEEECVGYRCLHDRTAEGEGRLKFVRATGDLASQLAQAICDFCARPWLGKTPAGKALKVDLSRVLAGVLGGPATPALVRERLAAEPALLGRTLAELGKGLPFSLVLVIDQGEEIFTLNWRPEDQARQDLALELLRQAVSMRGNFELVLALRTEYYGRLVDRLRRGVRDAVGVREYLLTDFDEGRLAEAILRPTSTQKVPYSSEVPFAKYGFRYADGVAKEIARQVVTRTRNRQDSVLPLAQVICKQLYDLACERADKVIVGEDLQRIGGIEGGMRKHVEGLLRRLFTAPRDRVALQRLLAGLYRKQPDGALTTDLLPAEEAARKWDGQMPFETMVKAVSEGDWRLLRVSMVRGEQGERPYLSLGHDALARVAEEWKFRFESRKRVLKWVAGFVAAACLALVMAMLALWAISETRSARSAKDLADRNALRAAEQEELAMLGERQARQSARFASLQRDFALGAFDTLLVEVRENLRETSETKAVRRHLLEAAVTGVNKLAQASSAEGILDAGMADARVRLGEVYFLLDDRAASQREFVAAAETARAVLEVNPDDGRAKLSLSRAETGSAMAALAAQDWDAAAKAATRAVAVVGTPADDDGRATLANAAVILGRLSVRRNNAAEARTWYSKAVEAAGEAPTDHRLVAARVRSLVGLCGLERDAGLITEAKDTIRRAIVTVEAVEPDRRDRSLQRDLVELTLQAGELSEESKELLAAELLFRKSQEAAERLVRESQGEAPARELLADTHHRLGRFLLRKNDRGSAREAFLAEVLIRRALLNADPTNATRRRALALNYAALGEVSLSWHGWRGARSHLTEALVGLTGDDSQTKLMKAEIHQQLMAACAQLGCPDEAEDHRRAAMALGKAAIELPKVAGPNFERRRNSLSMEFVLIPAGRFTMGNNDSPDATAKFYSRNGFAEIAGVTSNEGPAHEVTLTRPFFMGTTEVTRGQFRAFVEASGYKTDAEKDGLGSGAFNPTNSFSTISNKQTWWNYSDDITFRLMDQLTDEHPIAVVSWNDAMAFCAWLSRKEGVKYRLPTEAEWEYACRAGTTTRTWTGDDPAALSGSANVPDETFREQYERGGYRKLTYESLKVRDGYAGPAPVGEFAPNPWGLFDMQGNVWELCLDGYRSDAYSRGPFTDPLIEPGELHPTRGGCFM
jgi:formylglycine-generating enzyme required for sulfatase activity/tetratricopeptide (TPR) repeat protein